MDCTVLVTHYQTPDLLEVAVSSFRAAYPEISVIITDNGSRKDSGTEELLLKLQRSAPHRITVHRMEQNIFHGPAMDLAIRELVDTRFAFTLDSDTETLRGGFLEPMIASLEANQHAYACGRVLEVDQYGYRVPAGSPGGTPLCWVPYALFDLQHYHSLPPFEHHGVPNLANAVAARERGLSAINYPIADYIHHLGRGTAGRFGYGLGTPTWRNIRYRIERLFQRNT